MKSAMVSLAAEENYVKILLNHDIENARGNKGYRITAMERGIMLEGYYERGIT